MPSLTLRTIGLTATAMIAFAANSLLCRTALGQHLLEPATFGSVRIFAGAVTLLALHTLRTRRGPEKPEWKSAAMLATYMVCFSFAYVWLKAGTGALILFGAVQLTMFIAALRGGDRFAPLSWLGVALAVGGLIYLVAPGVSAPDPIGAVLMALAGIAWGLYSLLGRGAGDPVAATTRNFLYAAPLVLAVSAVNWNSHSTTPHGLIIAVLSGALASGCGYVIWYAALPHLSAGRAAIVQLSVPAIAAIGAVFLLSEPVTTRLLIASVATLGGIAIALVQRARA